MLRGTPICRRVLSPFVPPTVTCNSGLVQHSVELEMVVHLLQEGHASPCVKVCLFVQKKKKYKKKKKKKETTTTTTKNKTMDNINMNLTTMPLQVKLVQHTYACLFGNFLCNTSAERHKEQTQQQTSSVWTLLRPDNIKFKNYSYNPSSQVANIVLLLYLFRSITAFQQRQCFFRFYKFVNHPNCK